MNAVRSFSTTWRLGAFGIVALCAWWVGGSDEAPEPAAPASVAVKAVPAGSPAAPTALPTEPPLPAAAPSPPQLERRAVAGGTPLPPGVTAEEWSALAAELQDHPQREAELARIARYLGFQDEIQRFEALGTSPASQAERMALARSLQRELPRHWAARELSGGEAEALQRSILDVLEADPARRVTALIAWRQQAAVKPADVVAEASADAASRAAFAARQAEVVAAWNQQPEARRDPRQLETRLEALRQQLFGAP